MSITVPVYETNLSVMSMLVSVLDQMHPMLHSGSNPTLGLFRRKEEGEEDRKVQDLCFLWVKTKGLQYQFGALVHTGGKDSMRFYK